MNPDNGEIQVGVLTARRGSSPGLVTESRPPNMTKRGTGLHRGHYAQGQPDGGPGQPTATVKERAMYTTLGDLIDWLEKQDPNLVVKDGFSSPHSDRGSYDELAFDPEPEASIGDMLVQARSAVGTTFTGWKGGEYTMDRDTPVYIGEHGTCGDAITPIHFKYWILTSK